MLVYQSVPQKQSHTPPTDKNGHGIYFGECRWIFFGRSRDPSKRWVRTGTSPQLEDLEDLPSTAQLPWRFGWVFWGGEEFFGVDKKTQPNATKPMDATSDLDAANSLTQTSNWPSRQRFSDVKSSSNWTIDIWWKKICLKALNNLFDMYINIYTCIRIRHVHVHTCLQFCSLVACRPPPACTLSITTRGGMGWKLVPIARQHSDTHTVSYIHIVLHTIGICCI